MRIAELRWLNKGVKITYKRKRNRYRRARLEERRYLSAQGKLDSLLHPEPSDLNEFCRQNGIRRSKSGDSFYFEIRGKLYRVSNHTQQYSNECSWSLNGKRLRHNYHPKGGDGEVTIIAPRSQLKQIYRKLNTGI